jgi:hypothetical protein
MKWEIDYIKDHGIVEVKTSGRMSWDDKKKLSEETLAAGRKKNVNAFLMNQKETAFGLSVLEIDRLPAMFQDVGFGPEDKLAILINPDSVKGGLFKFLQNVLYLSSLKIQVFTDPAEATAWLKKENR